MLFSNFIKPSTPKLDPALADSILKNVLTTCGYKPHTMPLTVLQAHALYRPRRLTLKKNTGIAIMVSACATPVLVGSPDLEVTRVVNNPYLPVYEIQVDSLLPIDNVSIGLNGKELTIDSPTTDFFSFEPNANGSLCITVTLVNGQSATETHEVTGVDCTAPTATVVSPIEDCIQVHTQDNFSGIDFESITAIDQSGSQIKPEAVDMENGIIFFPYTHNTLQIQIADLAGNKLNMTVSPSERTE